MRKLLISRPGLPDGKFSGEPPPLISLPISGANGSRRTMFSRKATGWITRAVVELGTSAFAELTGLVLAEFTPDLTAVPLSVAAAGFAPVAAAVLGRVEDGRVGFASELVGLEAEPSRAVAAEAGLIEVAGLEGDDAAFTPIAGGTVGFVPWAFAVSVFGLSDFASCAFGVCGFEASAFAASGFTVVFWGFGAVVWAFAAAGAEDAPGFAGEAAPADPDFVAAG